MNVGALVDEKLEAGSKDKDKEQKTRKRVAIFEKQVKKGVIDMKVSMIKGTA